MPHRVRFVERDGELNVTEAEHSVYAVPKVGDVYWRNRARWTVVDADDTTTAPTRYLAVDRERSRPYYQGLPAGTVIDAGRDSETGPWHVQILGPNGRLLAAHEASDLAEHADAVVSEARLQALSALGGG